MTLLLLAHLPLTALAAAAPAEPILGSATGETEDSGSLTPVGDGRFAISERIFTGRIVARSVVDDWASCFTGRLTSTEEWLLDARKMTGSHESALRIRSDRGSVSLKLVGRMDFPSASGAWEITSGTGGCSGLSGEGRYTATYSSSSPEFRLTFDGTVRS